MAATAMVKAFFEGAKRATPSGVSALGPLLDELHAAAAKEWPGVVVSQATFAQELGRRLGSSGATEEGLRGIRASEVYLVCACASRDRRAIDHLEHGFFSKVRTAIARHARDREAIDDVVQALRERLLVGTPPAIGSFAGRGPLQSWLCAAAVRQTLDFLRANKRYVAEDEVELVETGMGSDAELEYIRRRHSKDFRVALRDAFKLLDAEERRLLRHSHIDGLTIDDIAALQKVHRSTAARQVVRARTRLVELTRGELQKNLALSDGALESLIRVVRDDLDVSLPSALKTTQR